MRAVLIYLGLIVFLSWGSYIIGRCIAWRKEIDATPIFMIKGIAIIVSIWWIIFLVAAKIC